VHLLEVDQRGDSTGPVDDSGEALIRGDLHNQLERAWVIKIDNLLR
jgi:hypothetical protein